MILNNILSYAKCVLLEVLEHGSIAIDATVGNGYDTVFLAQQVGRDGRVFGFDVQKDAIEQTREKLNEECLPNNWKLFHQGHEDMLDVIPEKYHGKISVVVFNLGFLPGSDKSVVTKAETTLKALDSSLKILAVGGIICIAIYAGHPGGEEEDVAVREFCSTLDYHSVRVIQSEMTNKPGFPIRLLFLAKLK